MGRKTPDERFPGAINTMTCEAMMGDGKALQMGTSHELGQNFAKAFDITYQDAEATQQLAWTTSWGVSTRMMGGLIMAHGDDAGLRLPPRIAPTQVVILVVRDGDGVGERVQLLAEALRTAGIRVHVDDRTDVGFGRRATTWELKGVPVRIELGPRDLADEQATLVRRDQAGKATVPLSGLPELVVGLMDEIQTSMLETARATRDDRTVDVTSVDEALEATRDRVRPDPVGRRRPEGAGHPQGRGGHRALPPEPRRRRRRSPTTTPTASPPSAVRTDPDGPAGPSIPRFSPG